MSHDYRPVFAPCPATTAKCLAGPTALEAPEFVALGWPDNGGSLRRLIERMRDQKLVGRRDPIDANHVILVRGSSKGSLSAGRVPRDLIEMGIKAECLVRNRQGMITVADDLVDRSETAEDSGRALPTPSRNDAESPLAWLRRRKGPDGHPLIDDRCFLAGERFRSEVTHACMLPSVTTNWSRMESSTGLAMPRDPALASDATVAARQRVRAAFRMLGNDMGNFVMDVCAFLMPLQEAEARRGWPARSGKLVLRMALDRLATHYGIDSEIQGPRTSSTKVWHADAVRTGLEAWLRPEQPD